MKKRRVAAVTLVMTMLISSLVGCGASTETNKEQTTKGETQIATSGETTKEGLEPITFTFYNADGQEDPWTDPVAQAITEATGVTLETDYPVDGDDQRVSLMIASSEYPDIIFAKGDADALIDAGALIDMTDLIEEYGPNIKKLYGENFARLKYSQEDPAIYQLASNGVGNVAFTTSGTAQLQWDVLAFNNYEIPYTLEQYEAQIKNYLTEHPTIDGLDTIGLSISCSDWHWFITLANPAGFINGYPDNGQWVIDDENNYEASYKHASEGQYEYFKWLNRMYNEGILDKDFATQTHDDYIAKLSTGRVLGLLDTSWDYYDAELVLKEDGKYERTYAGLPVTLNEDIECVSLMDQGLSTGWGVGITTACEDPVRAVQFLDWICTDEAQVLLNWGIEGVNYEIGEDGMRYVPEEEQLYKDTDVDYKKETGVGFHNYPFPRYGDGVQAPNGDYYTTISKDTTIKNYHEAERAALEAWNKEMLIDIFPSRDKFDISPYGAVWQLTLPAEFNEYETVLNDISWEYMIKSIVASPENFDETWEQFQNRLVSNGLHEANEMLTGLIRERVEFWSN